jgi:sterol desaturase/sphingolipid hydroxylase (fatty acid hydroxylase superfamily)
VVNAVTTFCSLFQHANLRTPRWLGYLIQRPESHGIHHQRGIHAFNYGDLPIWDMVFGTFRNPPTWHGVGGYADGDSARLAPMLLGRDISTPPPAAPRTAAAVEPASGVWQLPQAQR